MRTIKASEVREGLTIEAEQKYDNGDRECIAGIVTDVFIGRSAVINTENSVISLPLDHPVTVLAEPEPEWVEGAWYRTRSGSDKADSIRLRVEGGWCERGTQPASLIWRDDEEAVTVLGRVLIVDWPGDDVARDIVEAYSDNRDDPFTLPANQMAVKVADAIRTQGGAS